MRTARRLYRDVFLRKAPMRARAMHRAFFTDIGHTPDHVSNSTCLGSSGEYPCTTPRAGCGVFGRPSISSSSSPEPTLPRVEQAPPFCIGVRFVPRGGGLMAPNCDGDAICVEFGYIKSVLWFSRAHETWLQARRT